MAAYPILLIALGVVVLLLGKRLAVLGAAVGALLGAGLLNFFPEATEPWVQWLTVGGLALAGFVLIGFAKGLVNTVLLIIFALAGAAIALNLLELFELELGWMETVIAFVGALIGWAIYSRFRDGAMVFLAGLIGALLVTRGLVILMPVIEGPAATIIAIVLAFVGVGMQGGFFANRRAASAAQAQATAAAAQAQAAAAQAQTAAAQAAAAAPPPAAAIPAAAPPPPAPSSDTPSSPPPPAS